MSILPKRKPSASHCNSTVITALTQASLPYRIYLVLGVTETLYRMHSPVSEVPGVVACASSRTTSSPATMAGTLPDSGAELTSDGLQELQVCLIHRESLDAIHLHDTIRRSNCIHVTETSRINATMDRSRTDLKTNSLGSQEIERQRLQIVSSKSLAFEHNTS